ncbi:hypothetical protein JXI42_14660 [bacterium]|nr:hypothetical protein [bacterium]
MEPNQLLFQKVKKLDIFTLPFTFEPEETAFPDRLYADKAYFDAITEYKRYLFNNPDTPLSNYIHFKLALAYLQSDEYHEGIKELDYLIYQSDDREVSYKAGLILVLTYIGLGHFSLAEYEIIDKIPSHSESPKVIELKYWCGWTYLLQSRWDEARKQFMEIIENGEGGSQYYYAHAYALSKEMKLQPENIEYKSPNLAKWMSTVLPGLGQGYIGDWVSGAKSMGVNVLFGYLTGRAIANKDYFQGALIIYLCWSRFYFGSSVNAHSKAVQYNSGKDKELINFLIKKYIKPDSQ